MSLIEATLKPSLSMPTLTGTVRLHLMDRPCDVGSTVKDLDKTLIINTLTSKGRRTITQLIDDTRRPDAAIREAVKSLLADQKIRMIATRGKARFYEIIEPNESPEEGV